MNKSIAITLAVIGGLALIGMIFAGGFLLGRFAWGAMGSFPSGMMDWNGGDFNSRFDRMGTYFDEKSSDCWMDEYDDRRGGGMMGGIVETCPYGMMDDFSGRWGGGMMGGLRGGTTSAEPLTVDQARQAFEAYLQDLGNEDLQIAEIMVFDNNAYARVIEQSTGIGAMELLVDPSSLAVFQEYGPNMMWNLKYGHMIGQGGMMRGFGGMMGGQVANPEADANAMTVSADQALKIAQEYLDDRYPGSTVADEANPFYGYYTIDILKDGEPTGMLSVNGFSGQVFLHTWHGRFIEMVE